MLLESYQDEAASAAGLLTTKITESPLKSILLTYLSLFIAVPLSFPFPPLEYSVHISLTSSSNLVQLVPGVTEIHPKKNRQEH